MDERELRLELLKLTYTHGRDVSEAVSKAEVLENYVLGAAPAVPKIPVRKGRPPKIREAQKESV